MPKGKANSLHLDFTFQSLELIYSDMVRFLEDNPDKNKEILIERIRQMTEFQIWGEKNNDSFFEFFCEKNVPEVMLNLLNKAKSREIIVQIIQSLSMYLTNIKNPININYILSNNSINEFITHNFDFNDDEVVDYYISFLKSLSLRMETIPLELFYNKKYKDFPLISQAIKFYNHPGSMVRTSVQNITLTLFQLKGSKLDNYLTSFPFANYFTNLACYLKSMWIKIDENLLDPNLKNPSRVQELLDDQYDLLMYMEDIFKLKKEKINKILANALLSYVIIPTLLGPLAANSQGPISLNLSLYFLNLMFNSVTYTPILEFIFIFLFSSKLTNSLLALRQLVPDNPASYCDKWSFKTPWDSYPDVLYRKYMDLLEITSGNYDSIEIDLEALKSQSQKDTIKVEDEYRNLARYTGVIAEPSEVELDELAKLTPLHLLEEFKKHFSNKGDVINGVSLNSNPVKTNFLSFLLSRDDNMIMLMCSIFDSALIPTSNQYYVPAKIFSICNLLYEKAPVLSQPDSNIFKGEIQKRNETCKYFLDCLYKLLTVDPPFRIVTMRLITKLIIDLSCSSTDQVMISGENLSMFNAGYKNSIITILKFLQNSIVGDLFSELFETQWKEIYKQNFTKPKRRDYVYMLLPLVEENQSGLDPNMRLPVSEIEVAKREIAMFLLYRKIRYSLIKITRYSANFSENYRPSSGKENMSNSWEEGKLYEIDQRKLHQCQLKEHGNKQTCYIAEDEENFVLIAPDPTRLHWAKIVLNSKLKNTEALVDRTNASQLIITAKLKDKYYQKILIFSDKTKCFEAKKAIDDNRRYLKHYDMTILLKNFENAKNDIYEVPLIEF